MVSRPPTAISDSRRSYRLRTRPETTPHDGHGASDVRVRAWIRTDLPTWNTRSIHTQARCGKKTASDSEMVTKAAAERASAAAIARP